MISPPTVETGINGNTSAIEDIAPTGTPTTTAPLSPRSTLLNEASTPPTPTTTTIRFAMGDKDILLAREDSTETAASQWINQRPSNIHLMNFVEVFCDHYFASGHFERDQIVQRIFEMLQKDGYSFWKPIHDGESKSNRSNGRSSNKGNKIPVVAPPPRKKQKTFVDEEEGIILLRDPRLWVEASPLEVKERVRLLFWKVSPDIGLSSVANQLQQQQRQLQQQLQQQLHANTVEAFSRAIGSAIDTSSLAATLRHEEEEQLQQEQQLDDDQEFTTAALHQALGSAIDASSLAATLRDFPSPESSPVVWSPSSSSTTSSFCEALPELLQLPESHFSQQLPPSTSDEQPLPPQEQLQVQSLRLPAVPPSQGSILATSEPNHGSKGIETPASATVCRARQLLRNHLEVTETGSDDCGSNSPQSNASSGSALPGDGILWSEGNFQIRLLETDNCGTIVPVTSYSLFPATIAQEKRPWEKSTMTHDIENDASSPDDTSGSCDESIPQGRRTDPPRSEESSTAAANAMNTIGYTEQRVGNLTILRPIVLLPSR